jgi:hypothetical protein
MVGCCDLLAALHGFAQLGLQVLAHEPGQDGRVRARGLVKRVVELAQRVVEASPQSRIPEHATKLA